jgi:hypothetical protein
MRAAAQQPTGKLRVNVSTCQPVFQAVPGCAPTCACLMRAGFRVGLDLLLNNPIDLHPGYCGSNIIFRPCHQWHCTQLRCCNVYLSAQSPAHCHMLQFVIKSVGHEQKAADGPIFMSEALWRPCLLMCLCMQQWVSSAQWVTWCRMPVASNQIITTILPTPPNNATNRVESVAAGKAVLKKHGATSAGAITASNMRLKTECAPPADRCQRERMRPNQCAVSDEQS